MSFFAPIELKQDAAYSNVQNVPSLAEKSKDFLTYNGLTKVNFLQKLNLNNACLMDNKLLVSFFIKKGVHGQSFPVLSKIYI